MRFSRRFVVVALSVAVLTGALIVYCFASGGEQSPLAATPIAAKTAAKAEVSGGGWLGVEIQDLTDELREVLDIDEDVEGVLVAGVVEGGPADKAGIERGDVVVRVSTKSVDDVSELSSAIAKRKPGEEVTISLVRDGRKLQRKVVLGKREIKKSKDVEIRMPEPMPVPDVPALRQFKLEFSRGYLGVNVLNLTPELGSYFGTDTGVLVTEVNEGSAAEDAGIKPGDVIKKVEGEPVEDREDLVSILQEKEEGDEITLSILRKGKEMSLTATLEEGPFWGFMQGMGEKGTKFNQRYIVPRVERFRSDVELERRLETLSKELERLKDKLEHLSEELRAEED